jgi:hypothetical protein
MRLALEPSNDRINIALGCLALLFTLTERIAYAETVPLLSVRDLVELLAFYLPRKNRNAEQIIATLYHRHAARAASTESAARRRRKNITK